MAEQAWNRWQRKGERGFEYANPSDVPTVLGLYGRAKRARSELRVLLSVKLRGNCGEGE